MRVFLSSVISGMEAFRDVVTRAVRTLGHDPIRAEDFGAQPDSPQAACLAGVRQADAMVLLLGDRYGAVQPSGLSATHEEYREARERCPVLVMVQSGVERDSRQQQFLAEVQDWEQGHYTKSFVDADQLLEAAIGALHQLELSHATGPVDSDEMLQRAMASIPDERFSHSGESRLALVLTGGPLQAVLRPAQLEANDLRERMHQIALFGDAAILTTRQGTQVAIEDNALLLSQENQSVSIAEDGAIRFLTTVPEPDGGASVIVEEDVRELIHRFLRFSNAVLTVIDPVNRLSHVVLLAKIIDGDYRAWRTRSEHSRKPNSVSFETFGQGQKEAVHLSPPHRTRGALRQNAEEMAEDLVAKLRRHFKRSMKDY